MKDKRQRLALAWPYADPALAAYILHAAAASANYPYAPAAAASLYQAAYYPHPAAAAAAAAAAAGTPSNRSFPSSQSVPTGGAQPPVSQTSSGVPTQPPQHQSPAPGPIRGFHSPSHFSPIAAAAAAAAAAGGVSSRVPQNFPFPYLGRSPNLNLPGQGSGNGSPLGPLGVSTGLIDDLSSASAALGGASRLSVPVPMASTSPTSSSSNTSDNCHNCISVDGHSPNGLHSPGFHHHFHHLNGSLNSSGSVKSASPSPVSSSSPITNTIISQPALFQPYKESSKA